VTSNSQNIAIDAQSSQGTAHLAGQVDSAGTFSVVGAVGGFSAQASGQFTGSGINNGMVTITGPTGPCTYNFTASKRSF
jgi:hypothetical protein